MYMLAELIGVLLFVCTASQLLTERPICKYFDKCDKNKLSLSTLSK